jgi:hypothetical protein
MLAFFGGGQGSTPGTLNERLGRSYILSTNAAVSSLAID